jgi:hypothetical protein
MVARGGLSYGSVAALLWLYCAYVAVVAVADFTKRAGVEWGAVSARLSRRFGLDLRVPLLGGGGGGWDEAGGGGRGGGGEGEGVPLQPAEVAGLAHSLGALMESGNISELSSGESSPMHGGRTAPRNQGLGGGGAAAAPAARLVRQHSGSAGSVPSLRHSLSGGSQVEMAPPAPRDDSRHEGGEAVGHRRATPPVAAFDPRHSAGSAGSRYDDIVHMSTLEYRRRALADMAQAKSFYQRGPVGACLGRCTGA